MLFGGCFKFCIFSFSGSQHFIICHKSLLCIAERVVSRTGSVYLCLASIRVGDSADAGDFCGDSIGGFLIECRGRFCECRAYRNIAFWHDKGVCPHSDSLFICVCYDVRFKLIALFCFRGKFYGSSCNRALLVRDDRAVLNCACNCHSVRGRVVSVGFRFTRTKSIGKRRSQYQNDDFRKFVHKSLRLNLKYEKIVSRRNLACIMDSFSVWDCVPKRYYITEI